MPASPRPVRTVLARRPTAAVGAIGAAGYVYLVGDDAGCVSICGFDELVDQIWASIAHRVRLPDGTDGLLELRSDGIALRVDVAGRTGLDPLSSLPETLDGFPGQGGASPAGMRLPIRRRRQRAAAVHLNGELKS